MANEMICPNCGNEGLICWKFDAWACYEITGVDVNGGLLKSREFHTQVFDQNQIECLICGKSFNEEKIVELLRLADLRVAD